MAVFCLILVRTTGRPILPGFFHQWDILLPFIVYFAQRRTLPEGLILSLFTSHLYSLSSAAPFGVFAAHYLILFVIARLLTLAIYANTWFSGLLLMLSLSLVSRIVLTLVAGGFGHGWPFFSTGNFVWWGLLLNALIGYLVFGFCGILDQLTCKSPKINIELMDTHL